MTTKPSVIPDGTKWCNGCSQLKGEMDFATDNSRHDKLNRRCRPCDNRRRYVSQVKNRLTANPELVERYFAKGPELLERMAIIKAAADAKRTETTAKAKATKAKAKGGVSESTVKAAHYANLLATMETAPAALHA